MNAPNNVPGGVFRPRRLPSLSRLPKELGREERYCEPCGKETVHILYLLPKKRLFVYVEDHPENVHATCIECAKKNPPKIDVSKLDLSEASKIDRTGFAPSD